MEDLRRLHNNEKRSLIESVCRKGDSILDVGCGFGGDLQKWRNVGVNINMCEPNSDALAEAQERAKNMKMRVNFYHGDIHACPNRKYDVVCYNFALHYIFQTRDLFVSTLREIKKRVKPGGVFIGSIPDSERIIFKTHIHGSSGNLFKRKKTSNGDVCEKW